MADPRIDDETMQLWNALLERVNARLDELAPPEPLRSGIDAMLARHIPWESREQQLGDGRVRAPDLMLGVGCRSCSWMPNPVHVGPSRACPTVTDFAKALGVPLVQSNG